MRIDLIYTTDSPGERKFSIFLFVDVSQRDYLSHLHFSIGCLVAKINFHSTVVIVRKFVSFDIKILPEINMIW